MRKYAAGVRLCRLSGCSIPTVSFTTAVTFSFCLSHLIPRWLCCMCARGHHLLSGRTASHLRDVLTSWAREGEMAGMKESERRGKGDKRRGEEDKVKLEGRVEGWADSFAERIQKFPRVCFPTVMLSAASRISPPAGFSVCMRMCVCVCVLVCVQISEPC